MAKEISLRPAHFQSFHKGSENAVIESERLPGWVSFTTIFLSKRRRRSLFHGSAPHEASVGRVPQKILRTILAPEEPISAGPTVKEHTSDSPTVNVGPAANLRAGLAAADFPGRPNKARARQLPGAGLIVSIRLSRSRYLAAAAFLLLRDRAWMPSTTSTIARTTSRMAMIARM